MTAVILLPLLLSCAGYDGGGPSRCTADDDRIDCPFHTTTFVAAGIERDLHWQLPLGQAPDPGWPVAFVFQGSLFPAEQNWSAGRHALLGGYHQAVLTKELLDAGFAVLTPEARSDGFTCWDTNLPPWSDDWEASPDAALMQALLAAVEAGELGPLDPDHLFATGISSGGYMTSRMAVDLPGRFTALAVVSASYATCAGVACSVPDDLPRDHPPTLFLHGGIDVVVPVWTMQAYRNRLDDQGTEVDSVVKDLKGHAWFADAPDEIVDWFEDRR